MSGAMYALVSSVLNQNCYSFINGLQDLRCTLHTVSIVNARQIEISSFNVVMKSEATVFNAEKHPRHTGTSEEIYLF